MSYKICVLGNNSLYTKIICKKLDDLNINYYLINEYKNINNSECSSLLFKCLNFCIKLKGYLSSGYLKALPLLRLYTLRKIIKDLLFRRSAKYNNLFNQYFNYTPKSLRIFNVPHINHVKSFKIIESEKFDIGLFAGVGIVDGIIIDSFSTCCLNSHPAPLPECRGGGALMNTLIKGLKPSSSVHYATPTIDGGAIIHTKELVLNKGDCFNLINSSLLLLCADVLIEGLEIIMSSPNIKTQINDGQLHYWRDCTIHKQKQADAVLKEMLRKLQ